MLKADLRKAETDDFRAGIGRAVDEARRAAGWNLDELAHALGRDPRQVARWISGAERPQFDALLAIPELRGSLIVALARLTSEIEITTTLAIRRSA